MLFAVLPVVIFAAGLLAMLLPERMWAALAPKRSRWANQASTSAALLFGGLALMGVVVLALSVSDLWHGWQSTRWVPVDAVVESSRIVEVSQIRSTNRAYRVEPVYSYTVNGQRYTATRTDFGDVTSTDREAVEHELATRFAPGVALTAHVDPADPTEAVLTPGVQTMAGILAALGLAFGLIGVWQLTMLARDWEGDSGEAKRPRKRRRAGRGSP